MPTGWAVARRICASCPVRAMCLDDVMEAGPTLGPSGRRFLLFQAGLDPDELADLWYERHPDQTRRGPAVNALTHSPDTAPTEDPA